MTIDDNDPILGINERMLTATEALHFISHDKLPNKKVLPKHDLVTSSGQKRWKLATIQAVAEPIHYNPHKAACINKQDMFYSEHEDDVAQAKRLCATCPIYNACARVMLSLTVRQSGFGIWAGTAPEERRAWRSHQKFTKEYKRPS